MIAKAVHTLTTNTAHIGKSLNIVTSFASEATEKQWFEDCGPNTLMHCRDVTGYEIILSRKELIYVKPGLLPGSKITSVAQANFQYAIKARAEDLPLAEAVTALEVVQQEISGGKQVSVFEPVAKLEDDGVRYSHLELEAPPVPVRMRFVNGFMNIYQDAIGIAIGGSDYLHSRRQWGWMEVANAPYERIVTVEVVKPGVPHLRIQGRGHLVPFRRGEIEIITEAEFRAQTGMGPQQDEIPETDTNPPELVPEQWRGTADQWRVVSAWTPALLDVLITLVQSVDAEKLEEINHAKNSREGSGATGIRAADEGEEAKPADE